MPRLTIGEAKGQGYTVDTTCYPHLGYKGPRFEPTETVEVLTVLEADLLAACEVLIGEDAEHNAFHERLEVPSAKELEEFYGRDWSARRLIYEAVPKRAERWRRMPKHTPGPWKQAEGSFISIVAESDVTIAELRFFGHSVETIQANAHLIGAAPDLLAACEELVDLMDATRDGEYTPDSFTTQPARMAIVKAYGEEQASD